MHELIKSERDYIEDLRKCIQVLFNFFCSPKKKTYFFYLRAIIWNSDYIFLVKGLISVFVLPSSVEIINFA